MVRASLRLWIAGLLVAAAVAERAPPAHSMALLQGEGEVAETSTSDEAVVAARFGELPVTMENLKNFLQQRTFNDIGQMEDLVAKSACVIRLEDDMGAADGLTTPKLREYLEAHELSTAGNRDDLLERSCLYYSLEMLVIESLNKPYLEISITDLTEKIASLGFISTTGSKPELTFRLGKILRDINTVKELLQLPSFDLSNVDGLLDARGLATDGSTDQKLKRLADYLVSKDSAKTLPGVSPYCDMVLESGMCIHGGRKVLTAEASPQGLAGRWTFDDAHMLDSSGHGNHIKETKPFGPGRGGVGQSARFDANTFVEIPDSAAFSSGKGFCVTYWMYLLADSSGEWRTVLHKGERDNQRTPTFFMEPQTRGIEFFVSTTDPSQPAGERVWSNTFIPLRRWTHIAGCVDGFNLRLYINGILDAENSTKGEPIMNQGPLYVGADPWHSGIAGYVDDLRWYSRVLSTDEIQAEASPALGLVEPAFVQLGCIGCYFDNCAKRCSQNYRMCTQRDLEAGGYHVARLMGWSDGTRIWRAEDGKEDVASDVSGLCVCCQIDAV